ncbi:MAG TPA: polysaccharide deacetylase family protein, partial [Hanamia sp.]|nr:polysaccharide deacetylase family protein [Hanamia sp.]
FNLKKDPWDVYDYLSDTATRYHLNCILFFLVGDNSDKDRNLDYKNPQMKSLLKKAMRFCEIGLHPSFLSNAFPYKFAIEKKRLEKISEIQITKSRQHFLKFTMPNTYIHLISAGITEDYSMGFPEMPGFRAGTSHPFYFFDLKNEQSTQLTLFPVTCMNVTFMNYLQMSPEDTLQNMLKLATEVKKVNGTFISIWHNDSLFKESSTKNWHWVHDEVAAWLGKEIPE